MERKSFDARASSARPASGSESAEEQKAVGSDGASGASRRSAGETADAHEREGVTVRTAQVPRRRDVRCSANHDDDGEERLDFHLTRFGGWMQPAEVAHSVLSRQQHVPQIAPHKTTPGLRPVVFDFKRLAKKS